MANLCPTCLGQHFVYSPGGYAPKLKCPTCHRGPPKRRAFKVYDNGREPNQKK